MKADQDKIRGRLFVNFIKNFIQDIEKKKVLDVGCKYGAFTFELAKNFHKVVDPLRVVNCLDD